MARSRGRAEGIGGTDIGSRCRDFVAGEGEGVEQERYLRQGERVDVEIWLQEAG